MSHYLFSVMHDYVNDPPVPDPTKDPAMSQGGAFNESIADKIVFAGGLEVPQHVNRGARARWPGRSSQTARMPRPKTWLAGFWVIEAADLDEALSLAGRATAACGKPVEVRPFQSDS